jgi:hypothetical protein
MWDETWDGMTTLREPRGFDSEAEFAEPELEVIAFGFRYASFDDPWDMLVRIAGRWLTRSTNRPTTSDTRRARSCCGTSSPTASRTVPTPFRRQPGASIPADQRVLDEVAATCDDTRDLWPSAGCPYPVDADSRR